MTDAPSDPLERSAGSPRIQLHGTSQDSSTFIQIGTQIIQPSPGLDVRYSLPQDVAAFTGRAGELGGITAAVTNAYGNGGMVAIHAIHGMPGAGKTALAVHTAHLLRNRFPDRQLFIDLHAHTPGRGPIAPEAALAELLAAVGVDPHYLPVDLAGRAAMWRDKMAGQRALLVLDNAAGTAQVTPLLPSAAGCLVLVTSRRYLGDLPSPVVPVQVDALPPDQAQKMFMRLAPHAARPVATVDELAQLAGCLPLAISLLARVCARHPSWTLADLTAETRASLLTLAAENDSVAVAFEVSYRYLDRSLQRFFRRLGLHPGTTIDAWAAAALDGVSVGEAVGLLDALHGEGLLTEPCYRRYGMHDLIRDYARNLAAGELAADRDQGIARLLDYYQYSAAVAETLLARHPRTRAAVAPLTVPPVAVPNLPDRTRALVWARTERLNLLACMDHVTTTGQHARVVALTAALTALLRLDGPWPAAVTRHTTAVQAARHLGDRLGHADALGNLGVVRRLSGDYRGAAQTLQASLDLYRDLGNQLGQATALAELGAVGYQTSHYRSAVQALEASLDLYRDLGDRLGQATALTYLGAIRRYTGNYQDTTKALQAALNIYRDLGDRVGESIALTHLGAVQRYSGNYQDATKTLHAALSICSDLGYQLGQATALTYLGGVRRLVGDYQRAAQTLQAALNTYRDLGDCGGETEVLNELGTLHRIRRNLDQAITCHRQALGLAREVDSPYDEALALSELGHCALAVGRTAVTVTLLRQAQEIFQRIGAAEATNVAAELDTLIGNRPAT